MLENHLTRDDETPRIDQKSELRLVEDIRDLHEDGNVSYYFNTSLR